MVLTFQRYVQIYFIICMSFSDFKKIQLPDSFSDWYQETFGQDPSEETITHCTRELIHAVWMLILNTAFMTAYQFGILVQFADQVVRRVFPRLFAYIADYPEKYALHPLFMFHFVYHLDRVLMTGIRNMGLCPCPRCLIEKKDLSAMGTHVDTKRRGRIRVNNHHFRTKVSLARDIIYRQGYRVNTEAVDSLLKEQSLVPTTVCL